jgi:hypothetical protein
MAQIIKTGLVNKTAAGSLVITFESPFVTMPEIVVSPFWKNSGQGVGYIETITSISLESFTINSGNAASNYFVTWIAIAD